MKLESLVLGTAGICFGVIVGWVLGSQHVLRSPAVARPASAPSEPQQAQSSPPIDMNRVQGLEEAARRDPKNVDARVELGNLYYDGDRCGQAIPWYEAALTLSPNNVNVSTDLGVCYYQTNQPDKALLQFEHSLKVDAKHVKTLLNIGIVRAFSKQDLDGAVKAWKRVVELAPGSQEAQLAERGLSGIASAHPNLGSATPANK